MTDKCTSNGSCTAGFMECAPCPFTLDHYYSGVVDELVPIIETELNIASVHSNGVLPEVDELQTSYPDLIGDEVHIVRDAILAKLNK